MVGMLRSRRGPILLCALALLLAAVPPALAQPRPSPLTTVTFNSDCYEVVTNLDGRDARAIAHHMDLVFREYERRLSSFGTRNAKRIRLYLMKSYDDYLAHIAAQGIDGANSGGMFYVRGSEAGLITFEEGQSRRRMLGVLQHEGFHQFAFVRISADLPPWVNEGLAEYFEQAVLVRTQFRIGQAARTKIERLQAALKDENTFEFEHMLSMTSREWAGRVSGGDPRAITMYDQAWSMVHFLIHARDGRFAGMFEDYLKALAQGMDPPRAFEHAFDTDDIGSFQTAWAEYVAALEPDPLSTVIENLEVLTPMIAELHNRGQSPRTVESLREALEASGIIVRRFDAGLVRQIRADDPALFEIPQPERRTRPPSIEPIPAVDDQPLGLEVRGLEATVRLVWRKHEGQWIGDVEFR